MKRLFLFLSLVVASIPATGAVRMACSDLLSSSAVEIIEASLSEAGIEAKVTRMGSMLALEALRKGEIDTIIVARPEAGRVEDGEDGIPVAYQVVTVVVHESNPIRSLSIEQLGNIFAEGGNLEEWGRLGGTDQWSSRRITAHALRQPESIGLELFKQLAVGPRPLRSNVRFGSHPQAVLSRIAEDPAAVGVLSGTPSGNRVRTLFISEETGGQAYSPTPDNVMFGDYSLRLPFYLLTSEGISDEAERAVKLAVFGDAFAEVLEASGLMPPPERERRDRLMEAELQP